MGLEKRVPEQALIRDFLIQVMEPGSMGWVQGRIPTQTLLGFLPFPIEAITGRPEPGDPLHVSTVDGPEL